MTSHTVLPSRLMTRNSHGCRRVSAYVNILHKLLTRAPLGIFITRPTGGGYFEPPSDLRNYWADSKNSSGI